MDTWKGVCTCSTIYNYMHWAFNMIMADWSDRHSKQATLRMWWPLMQYSSHTITHRWIVGLKSTCKRFKLLWRIRYNKPYLNCLNHLPPASPSWCCTATQSNSLRDTGPVFVLVCAHDCILVPALRPVCTFCFTWGWFSITSYSAVCWWDQAECQLLEWIWYK